MSQFPQKKKKRSIPLKMGFIIVVKCIGYCLSFDFGVKFDPDKHLTRNLH